MVVSPDGERIYLEPEGSATAVLRTSDLSSLGTLPFAGPIAVSPDSSAVYIASFGNIEVISAASLELTASISYSSFSNGIGIAPNGSELYVATEDQQLCVLNVATLALSCTALSTVAAQVTVSPNGTVYLVAGSPEGEILVFDPASRTVTGTHQLPSYGALAVSPSGNQLYYAGDLGQISSTGAVPSTEVVRFAASGEAVGQGVYDAADNLLLFEDYQGFVEVFNGATLRMTGIVQVPDGAALLGYSGAGISISNQPFNGASGGVVRSDPVSTKITGEVGVPCSRYNRCLGAVSGDHAYVFFSGVYPSDKCYGIEVVNTATLKIEGILPHPVIMPAAFGISPADKTIGYEVHYGEYGSPSSITEVDLTSGAVINQGRLPTVVSPTASLAVSPDASKIYVVLMTNPNDANDGTLYALDALTLKITASADLDIHGFPNITPDGQYLYSQEFGDVAIISSSTLQIVGTVPTSINVAPVVFVGN